MCFNQKIEAHAGIAVEIRDGCDRYLVIGTWHSSASEIRNTVNSSDKGLYIDLNLNDSFKNYNAGDGTNYPMDYSFRIFTRDLNGNTVGSSFNLTYRYQGPLSIEQIDQLSLMGIKVLNTSVKNFIGLEITKPVQYSIINLQGQTIRNGELYNNTNIDLSIFQTGLYFINFKNQEGLTEETRFYFGSMQLQY